MDGNASASRSGLTLAFFPRKQFVAIPGSSKNDYYSFALDRGDGTGRRALGFYISDWVLGGGFNSVGGSPPILRYAHNSHPPPPHRFRGNQIAASGDLVTPRMGGVSHKFSSLAIASGLKDIGYVEEEGVCECLRVCEWLHAIIQVSRRLGLWPKNEGRESGRG